jgi:pyruvate dehydrogenase E1 component
VTTIPAAGHPVTGHDYDTLREVEQRVLWLSTAMIDHANRVRPNPSGLKVGGHQASSASMVTIMTSLWFEHLRQGDRVSVKPHASPVLHAINYLLGELDESYLTALRSFGGLQSYPSRWSSPPGRWASAPPPRSGAPSPAATWTPSSAAPAPDGSTPW